MWGSYERLGLPVWASEREIIRAVRSKIRPECLIDRDYREGRRYLYLKMLECHHKSRIQYDTVMRGSKV